MVHLSRRIEKQLHELRKEIMPNIEIDSTKYGQIAYEHFCLGNNIPPNWNGLEIEQQESWIEMADAVILEYNGIRRCAPVPPGLSDSR
ncbi:MAG: hypothetical protein HWQ38_08095 [Nostoc sp. NMS7]|uniref:hypothetical protein n=1 Tax=Nostoc sp. NMS7 TaxID=2815391 RepID=UPI0025FD2E23|nr:hypothetical protein [Nostoc sp. NMS7]MBN3946443.1 hypothetical protein [Nostoc sp. NMS7]